MHYGPLFVSDFEEDMKLVQEIFDHDYFDRWEEPLPDGHPDKKSSRSIPRFQTLGGKCHQATHPLSKYTESYNTWLKSIPDYILAMVFIIKRFHKPSWGDDWKSHFGGRYRQRKTGTRTEIPRPQTGRHLFASRVIIPLDVAHL